MKTGTDIAVVTEADLKQMICRDEHGDVVFNLHPDRMVMRARILALKDRLLSLASDDQSEMPVEHQVENGLYTRKLFIPAETILVGKIHLKGCFNCVERGDITVMTETGTARVQAGYNVMSPAGIQKVGYAHTDTVFVNVFRTDKTDIAEIEAEIACESFEALGLINEIAEALCQ